VKGDSLGAHSADLSGSVAEVELLTGEGEVPAFRRLVIEMPHGRTHDVGNSLAFGPANLTTEPATIAGILSDSNR
jgi:hypothetical protein